MNNKIIIKDHDEKIIYNGLILDMPIKEEYIIKKSIDIFDDEDPCIIHKSYVIKKIVDEFLKYISSKDYSQIKLSTCDFIEIDFINIDNIEKCTMLLNKEK